MKDRILITTPLKSTWPIDGEPVLFLGEWCKLFSQQHLLLNMDYKVVPYHWDDRKKLNQDFFYLIDLYEVILQELSEKLNLIHDVNHSLRYWRILVGPWLLVFIPLLYDRWESLQKASSSFSISKTSVLDYANLESIAFDMSHFEHLMKTDHWNHFIYSSILNKTKLIKTSNVKKIPPEEFIPSRVKPSNSQSSRELILKIIKGLSNLLSGNNNIFIIDSYLSKIDLLKLQLKLFQFPALYSSPEIEQTNPEMKTRDWSLPTSKGESSFEIFVREFIPIQIPAVYLEGYEKLNAKSNTMPWPSNPKLIWSSNTWYAEEVFKIWSAKKAELGVPLVAGQHGGVYGTGLFSMPADHELKICDYFLSWGSKKWDSSKNNNKIIPIGIFKKYKKRIEKTSVLMISSDLCRYSNSLVSLPMSTQCLEAFDNEFTFISLLPDYILNDLVVRPFKYEYGWSYHDRLKDRFPKIKIDAGEDRLENLFLRSKISISTWNATTYLETLSLNIPTMIFWDPEHSEVKKSAEKYFDILKKVGIFHDNPESAANHLIKIWGDIDGWWESSEVMSAKDIFIDRYANNKDLLGKLTRALQESAN